MQDNSQRQVENICKKKIPPGGIITQLRDVCTWIRTGVDLQKPEDGSSIDSTATVNAMKSFKLRKAQTANALQASCCRTILQDGMTQLSDDLGQDLGHRKYVLGS
jgi:hypothetical protein